MTNGKGAKQKKKPRTLKPVTANRNIKDSVFTSLFRDRNYLLQLYQALHPEDRNVTKTDLKYLTLDNTLMNGIYNDLGFQVGDRIIILVECQVKWSLNIIIRIFLYMAKTYQEYIVQHQLDIHDSVKVSLPRPEFYMLYIGSRKRRTKIITAKDFFGVKEDLDFDIRVHVLYGDNNQDIIGQYVLFTKIFDEQRKLYGYTEEAVRRTIEICKRKDILRKYLISHEKEVSNIMITLFDDKQIQKFHDATLRRRVAKKVRRETAEQVRREDAEKFRKETEKVRRETAEQVRRETLEESIERGVAGMIRRCRRKGETTAEAVEAVMDVYGLSEKESRNRVNMYWN